MHIHAICTNMCIYIYTHICLCCMSKMYGLSLSLSLSLSEIYIYIQSLNKAMGVMGRQLRRVLGAWLGACEALGTGAGRGDIIGI